MFALSALSEIFRMGRVLTVSVNPGFAAFFESFDSFESDSPVACFASVSVFEGFCASATVNEIAPIKTANAVHFAY